MLLSAASLLVVAQSSSEIPEGLTNNSVHYILFVMYSPFRSCLYFRKMNIILNTHMIDSLRERGLLFRYSDWATGWPTAE